MQVERQETSFLTYGWRRAATAYLVDAALLQDVHVHDDVLVVELDLVLHVIEQASDLGGEVEHVGGLVLLEEGADGVGVARDESRGERRT